MNFCIGCGKPPTILCQKCNEAINEAVEEFEKEQEEIEK